MWKATPAGWVKGVWWNLKDVKRLEKKEVVPKEAVRRANPIIPRPAAYAVWTSLRALKASLRPAVLARAASTTPAQGADEGGAKAPPRGAGTPAL